MHYRLAFIRSLILVFFCTVLVMQFAHAQRIVDQNKGNHFLKKKGSMDGNLVETIYYNYGEIADWQFDPTHSGVWPKGTNHTYLDGVAVLVPAGAPERQGPVFHPPATDYLENQRPNPPS